MRRSILETREFVITTTANTVTTAAGVSTITGTNFVGNTLGPDDFLAFNDNAGKEIWIQILSVQDDTNLTLRIPAPTTATAKVYRIIRDVSRRSLSFYVDNSLNKSLLLDLSSNADLVVGNNVQWFSPNEGFQVESIYLRFPYQFTMAMGLYRFALVYHDFNGNNIGTVQTIGEGDTSSGFTIPFENTPIEIDTYVPPPTEIQNPTGGKYTVKLSFENTVGNIAETDDFKTFQSAVSMVGSPDVLNFQVLLVPFGMTILHAGEPLTNVP